MREKIIRELPELETIIRLFIRTARFKWLIRILTRLVVRIRKKRIILVIGFSRSGTTMLGEFLGFAEGTCYIHEPIKQVLMCKCDTERQHQDDFWKHFRQKSTQQERLHALVCTILFYSFKSPSDIHTIIVKPIMVVDSIREIEKKLGFLKVVYISRHPCGHLDSMIRQQQYENRLKGTYTNSRLRTSAANWAEKISDAQCCLKRQPGWIWILFEEITANPTGEFERLFQRLQLNWTPDVKEKIIRNTTAEDGGFYETKRNAASQAEKWKQNLTAEQIETIRKGCMTMSTNLYAGF